MPYLIRKVNKKKCFSVSNKKSRRIYSKCTTKKKAKKQVRLLNALENNAAFRKKLTQKRKQKL